MGKKLVRFDTDLFDHFVNGIDDFKNPDGGQSALSLACAALLEISIRTTTVVRQRNG